MWIIFEICLWGWNDKSPELKLFHFLKIITLNYSYFRGPTSSMTSTKKGEEGLQIAVTISNATYLVTVAHFAVRGGRESKKAHKLQSYLMYGPLHRGLLNKVFS